MEENLDNINSDDIKDESVTEENETIIGQTKSVKTRLDNTKEKIQSVEKNSSEVKEMVRNILGDSLEQVNGYISLVSNCFFKGDEILDDDLNRIILRIPVYIYSLIVVAQEIEMKRGVAKEQASYSKNEAFVSAHGTVGEKTAKADMASVNDRIVEIAYRTAALTVQKTIDGAIAILDSAKKVQQQRLFEKKLTGLAGGAVGGGTGIF